MSFPTLDLKILNQAAQKLQDHEYVSLDMKPEDQKAQQVAYVVIEKSGSSLRMHTFQSMQERQEFISSQLLDFRRV